MVIITGSMRLASNTFLCIFVTIKSNVVQFLIFKLFTLVSNSLFQQPCKQEVLNEAYSVFKTPVFGQGQILKLCSKLQVVLKI